MPREDMDILESFKGHIDSSLSQFTWWLLASLVILFLWVVFSSLYASRVTGAIMAFVITRYMRIVKIGGSISIGSVSISPIAGKLVFRRVIYACEDFTIRVNDGFIILSYWKFVPNTSAAKSCTSRLGITLNGLQVNVYNTISRYRDVAKLLRMAHLFPEEEKTDVPMTETKDSGSYEKLWSLIGMLRISISSSRIVFGNALLPYMMVTSFENLSAKVILEESLNDKKLLNVRSSCENVRMVLKKHPQYKGKVMEEPPRTMGDGFVLLQTAELTLFYFEDILGMEKMEEQSLTECRPVWESIWRFGHNTQITYGPWAEKQRAILVGFFFPPLMGVAPVTEMPKKGFTRIKVLHEARISLLEEASLDICFLRGDELENITSTLGPGSSIDMTLWWLTTEEGFKWTAAASFLNMESSTTLVLTPFLSAEMFSLEMTALYPRVANAKQSWSLRCLLSKSTLHFTSEHIPFLSDLSSQWVGNESADLCSFVPYNLTVETQVQDFEVILYLNEANWCERTTAEDNWKAAIVGQHLSLNCVLPFEDFAPEVIHVVYDVRLKGECAVRMNMPPSRSGSSLYGSLHSSAPSMNAPPSRFGRTTLKNSDWKELWRTEEVDVILDHKFHPMPGEFHSELPVEVASAWLPPPPSHPFQLTPDSLFISVDVHSSELIVSGIVIRLLINLIENYCSSYDKMTGVESGEEAEKRLPPGKGLHPLEKHRPLSILFALRLHHIRGFCLSHSTDLLGNAQVICEQIEVEVDKNYERSMIQVSVGSCAVRIDGDTHVGTLTLSSIQVRGDALFSPLGVSLDLASLEYSWTLQVLVGEVTANLNSAQLVLVAEFVHSLISLAVLEDDKKRIPARLERCLHGAVCVSCPQRPSPAVPCPDPSTLQYRLLRISVDSLKALVVDDSTALSVEVSSVRLLKCNWESVHVGIGVHSITTRLLLNEPSGKSLEAAKLSLAEVDLSIRLRDHDANESETRKAFVRCHDEATGKRLPFVWKKDKKCACEGKHVVFKAADYVGLKWKDGRERLGQVEAFQGGRMGYMESLLRRGERACQSQMKAVYLTRKGSRGSTSSASSFHSFTNDITVEGLAAYSAFLPSWRIHPRDETFPDLGLQGEVDDWIVTHSPLMTMEGEGIGEGRLLVPAGGEAPATAAVDGKVHCVQGKAANRISLVLSPVGVMGAVEMAETIARAARKIRVSYDIQNMYVACADAFHRQPVLESSFADALKSGMEDVVVNVDLPYINVTLLSAATVPSALLICIQNSQLATSRDAHRSQFTLRGDCMASQSIVLNTTGSPPDFARSDEPLKARAVWKKKAAESQSISKVISELFLPSPSATLNMPHKKGEVHVVQVEVVKLETTVVVVEGDTNSFAPALLAWGASIGDAAHRLPKVAEALSTQRQWMVVHLLSLSHVERDALLKSGKSEMGSVRANSRLSHCPSCNLCLALLKFCGRKGVEVEEGGRLPTSLPLRRQALIMALAEWQKPLASAISVPKDVDVKLFEREVGEDGGEGGAGDGHQRAGGQGADLYQYLRSHRKEKKKKEKQARTGANFDAHAFFYCWYNKLGLDETAIDGLSSQRVKAKLMLRTVELNVLEFSDDKSFSRPSIYSLFSVDQLQFSSDVEVKISRDRRLLLPSQADITAHCESHVKKIRLALLSPTIKLLRQVVGAGADAVTAFGNARTNKKIILPASDDPPGWVVEVKKRVAERERDSESGCRRAAVPVMISMRAEAMAEVVSVDGSLFDLSALLSIEHTKAQLSFKRIGTDWEAIADGEIRKSSVALKEGKVVGNSLGSIAINDTKVGVRKKPPDVESAVSVKVASVEGTIATGLLHLHRVVQKYSSEVVKSVEVILPPSSPSPAPRGPLSLPPLSLKVTVGVVDLSAVLAPTLRAVLRVEKIVGEGRGGSHPRGTFRIDNHFLMVEGSNNLNVKLPLPKLNVLAIWRESNDTSITLPGATSAMPAKRGHYLDLLLTIGSVTHCFSTNVLNIVAYIQLILRTELNKLLESNEEGSGGGRGEKTLPPSPDSSILYFIRVESVKEEPWLSLTASTPTKTGVRVTMSHLLLVFTNRCVTKAHRLLGRFQLHTSIRLGQLMGTEEMDEFATFTAQLSMDRKETGVQGTDAFSALLSRPVAILHPRGVEKAILLWLHCNTSYKHWAAENADAISALDDSSHSQGREAPAAIPLLPTASEHNVSLSLALADMSLRVPLRPDSCLLLILKKADASVWLQKELCVAASFDAFKTTILEGLTQEANLDYNDYSDDDVRSNFIFFPQGTLNVACAANAADSISLFRLTVVAKMSGMVVDMDQRVGRLAKMLVSAFSLIGEMYDDRPSPAPSMQSLPESDDDDDVFRQMERLPPHTDHRLWLDAKIQKQAELVESFVSFKASDMKLEEERKVLGRLEQARLKYYMKKIRSGDTAEDKTKSRSSSKVEPPKGDRLRMSIHAELGVESGRCSLHTMTPLPSGRTSLRGMGRPSHTSNTTKLTIPGVAANGIYHSGTGGERGFLHARLTLQSTTAPQIVTPHLADFIEQVLEPIPTSWVGRMESSPGEGPSPLESSLIDSALPFDLILVLNVDASQINFVSLQYQRTSAADCRLQLPSLSFAISSRLVLPNKVSLDLSASLSAFSLSIYSPHQTAQTHDALSLSIDHLAFVLSRSKNAGAEPANSVQIVMTTSVGRAEFIYDMKRLSELVSFPKPWYRASVARRLFFGDKYMRSEGQATGIHSKEKRWKARIVAGIRWKELDVKAQMGNTMGNTNWRSRGGEARFLVQLTSEGEGRMDGMFALSESQLEADGGGISGHIKLSNLDAKCSHSRSPSAPPSNSANLHLGSVTSRLEYMSRPIVIAEASGLSLSFTDDWKADQGPEVLVSGDAALCWKTLQLVITRTTVDDLDKATKKLVFFFNEQLLTSKRMWEVERTETLQGEAPDDESRGEEEEVAGGVAYWQAILDRLVDVQSAMIFPFPKGSDGRSLLAGTLRVEGETFSAACMNGEMSASTWALFHLTLPSLLFSTQASLTFVGDPKQLVRQVKQKAIIKIGKNAERSDRQATVCKVQNKSGGLRQKNDVGESLDEIIGGTLRQLGYTPSTKQEKGATSALELFQFPGLEACYESLQEEPCAEMIDDDDETETKSSVITKFVCHFYGVLSVQTQLNAQLGFLPDLIKSYAKSANPNEAKDPAHEEKSDRREHTCIEWKVDPRIGFIDKFRWEPPAVDEILRRLQIFDHRKTIPKVLQRALMDNCDKVSATILEQMIKAAIAISKSPNHKIM